ncbi:hypothetical protein JYU34_020620 [Plutella xylostella]|uniref:Uncharacterized protein n=1 Tax=Plutella xylostella TaxID=51655 RepID=A0ABQ7PYJ1_PLUXY|nr:hypothetical protein JYU34_020620 [Plutella xylostella]
MLDHWVRHNLFKGNTDFSLYWYSHRLVHWNFDRVRLGHTYENRFWHMDMQRLMDGDSNVFVVGYSNWVFYVSVLTNSKRVLVSLAVSSIFNYNVLVTTVPSKLMAAILKGERLMSLTIIAAAAVSEIMSSLQVKTVTATLTLRSAVARQIERLNSMAGSTVTRQVKTLTVARASVSRKVKRLSTMTQAVSAERLRFMSLATSMT